MTPAAHWSPDDYYRASRAARRAWEATQPQLVIGLGETDGPGTTSLVGASVSPNPPSPHLQGTPSRVGEGGFDIKDGICAEWLHWFMDTDDNPCQCQEFASAEHLRTHNRRPTRENT